MATAEQNGAGCDKSIDGWSTIDGATFVAAADTGFCTNTDLDTFVVGGDQYVIVGGGEEGGFTILRYEPLSTLEIVSQVVWALPYTYTADVKVFTQGFRTFAALFLERRAPDAGCGVVIVDITDPPSVSAQSVVSQTTGADWCDVHNGFVESIGRDGRYLYMTANATRDLRVLDILDPASPQEIAQYRHPAADTSGQVYVHDVTVFDHGGGIGRRVYVSYWAAGLILLDADDLTGVTPSGGVQPLTPINGINPAGIRVHHALPNTDGDRVFIQDEFPHGITSSEVDADEPVQMWDITSPATPRYVDGIDTPSALMPIVNQAHNLELPAPDIDVGGASQDVIFVGWYRGGLRAFTFDGAGFTGAPLHHQVQTQAGDAAFEGSWGARVVELNDATYAFHADRRYGLIVDIVGEDPDRDNVENVADNCHMESNPAQNDSDGDLLGDACEGEAGTDPAEPDSDGDGCADGRELRRLTFSPENGGWRDPLNHMDFLDLDTDLSITVLDLAIESRSFLAPPDAQAVDVDGDGIVTIIDVSSVSAQFLHSCA
jgi:hypothetical protein